jgi:hypothetical protein
MAESNQMVVFRAITLITKAASTSETSANFYQTIRRYNPENSHSDAPISFDMSIRSNVELANSKVDITEIWHWGIY